MRRGSRRPRARADHRGAAGLLVLAAHVVAVAPCFVGCGAPEPARPPADRPPRSATTSSDTSQPAAAETVTPAPVVTTTTSAACPDDMALVDVSFCPSLERRCLKDEYEPSNHLHICHRFAEAQRCRGPERRQRYCIDRYEYPDRAGAHPVVMVDFFDAARMCGERGKRLCWESEWTAACEGPEHLPFPYGRARDASQCNIDNPWRGPTLDRVYSRDRAIQIPELLRLDQSAPSGAREGCVSGFGVHDLTGNVDEWVMAEAQHDTSGRVGLKGGAWGHVRNACRPMTTSHAPDFTYYFVSFRCCADAAPPSQEQASPPVWTPPALVDTRDTKALPSLPWSGEPAP